MGREKFARREGGNECLFTLEGKIIIGNIK